ncbi:hypothetical protein GCM10022403_056540 [Streptomyces coacervatus]|uniref:8-amino-7-oxononanoate synthase n=1 Tax=Streptomyces coacervatus TaxID=647381 RepID=A0ABP7IDH2_9ACTN|nr:hypothetical protein [Streptomyces coacervatus]MDF2268982.1 hypothetical protein [Streptomyces coacervatus]
MATIEVRPQQIQQGGRVSLFATPSRQTAGGTTEPTAAEAATTVTWEVIGFGPLPSDPTDPVRALWDVPDDQQPGAYTARVTFRSPGVADDVGTADITVQVRPFAAGDSINVQLRRAGSDPTDDQALWTAIRRSTDRISFNEYSAFIDPIMCNVAPLPGAREPRKSIGPRALPFPGVDAYRLLKVATEVFLIVRCGVLVDSNDLTSPFEGVDLEEERRRYGESGDVDGDAFGRAIQQRWLRYISAHSPGERRPDEQDLALLPYLGVIRLKLGELAITDADKFGVECFGILRDKLTFPCFLELIWSYWHEEGMLVQSTEAIASRFQNLHGPGDYDPLAHVDIDPLRALNQLMWGYVQDEQNRLSPLRRAYEYDHQYGITQLAPGGPPLRPVDSRPRFLEAFHTLLSLTSVFFREDDDTTIIADGFPVLNALKDVHLLLTEGQHNQYGDLPWTARQEMLMEEWLLARPEMREFLPGRTMVAYPEQWMDRVDTMKRLQGWTPDTVIHFRDLGRFGEQLLLSIRYGNWNAVNDRTQAANWARYWRSEIQGYLHSYRSVTGVDLGLERVDTRIDATMPAVHLRRRLLEQQGRHTVGAGSDQRGARQLGRAESRAQLPRAAARAPRELPRGKQPERRPAGLPPGRTGSARRGRPEGE